MAQRDTLIQQRLADQDIVVEKLAEITTHYTLKVVQLENRIEAQNQQNQVLNHQIQHLNNQVIEQINATNDQRGIVDNYLASIQNKDQMINQLENQLKSLYEQNETRIEEAIKVSQKF